MNSYPHHRPDVTETELMLRGYGRSLVKFYFFLPDFKHVLNEFTWGFMDLAPDFPRMFEFIEFWQERIEGRLHSVTYNHNKLIRPGEWKNQVGEFRIH